MGPPELQSFIFWVEILRLKLEPKSWDWSLEAGMEASRQEWEPCGGGADGGEGGVEICPMCESIGHWPLLGCCPKKGAYMILHV